MNEPELENEDIEEVDLTELYSRIEGLENEKENFKIEIKKLGEAVAKLVQTTESTDKFLRELTEELGE